MENFNPEDGSNGKPFSRILRSDELMGAGIDSRRCAEELLSVNWDNRRCSEEHS